jgi:predicted Zn-dependent protease
MGLDEPTAALRDAQHAAAECPKLASAWLAATLAYDTLGRSYGVERIYSQALEANPQELRLAKAYATWLLANGRAREAVAIVRRLTRNMPASLGAWHYYGSVCHAANAECSAEAARGLADARTRFGMDLEPEASAPNGLFGRFVSR